MIRFLPFFIFFWTIQVQISAQISINEALTANYNGIVDEDTENSDWIELYNPTQFPINLEGYSLTDDKLLPTKWTFPSFELKAQSYLVVFASEKNRAQAPINFKTIINRGDNWKYHLPTSNIGNQWRTAAFDDASWSEGPSGFGYGDDDDNTVLDPFQTIFIRKKFEVGDKAKVKKMFLHIDYDDGFVAYINGVEVARADLDFTGDDVPYNAKGIEREARMYRGYGPNEYEITNLDQILVSGTNVIAIQGHNMSSTSSDFSLIPFITIGATDIPSGTYVHPYFMHGSTFFHTNFKISKEGETVYLFTPAMSVADTLKVPALRNDISYGRQPDANKNCYYFGVPTPGNSNNQPAATTLLNDSVFFSSKGGLTPSGTSLLLSAPLTTDKIYFTTNGDVPTPASTLYTSPIQLTTDTVIAALIVRNGALPGPVTYHTYVVNRSHKFHITTLSTDPSNLWDINTGIYVTGLNASETRPYYGANYWQDWERAAQFEVFTPQGTNVVNQGVGIKIYGAYSRTHAQKSMAVFARAKYGKGSLNYKFFDDKNISKFESLVLRNAGQDAWYCMFRDGFITGLTRSMDLDRTGFKPSAHYLNGKYWGILNVREKINEHFLADNHQFDTEDIKLLESDGKAVIGTNEDYKQLLSFVENNNLNTSTNYNELFNRMEVNNYIQYQLAQIYINNGDWPGNNIKFWRVNTPDSKWRWIFFDTDLSYANPSEGVDFYVNGLAKAIDDTQTDWPNPAWSTLLFRRLLTSTTFRNDFVNQYCDHLNTTFLPTNVVAKIDSLKNLFDGEINHHWDRWPVSNYTEWLKAIERVRTFARNRPEYALTHLSVTLGVGEQQKIYVNVNDLSQGQVKVNSVVVNQAAFTGTYFQNIPIKLKAMPKPGYKFDRWEGTIASTSPEITYPMGSTATFTAYFTPATASDVSVVVNEINFKSADDFDTSDWIELYNNGTATVDLGGWELTDMGKEAAYFFPAGTILYPGEYIVVCEKIKNFRNYRTSVRNSRGNFAFGLSSSGDKIRLFDASGILMDAVDYGIAKPWPVFNTLLGGTLELISPNLDNSKGESWAVNLTHGTPGKLNAANVSTPTQPIDTFTDKLSCFPNPFKNFTTLEIAVSSAENYKIEVFDSYGRTVKVLLNQTLEPEVYYLDWDGTDHSNNNLPKGIYYIRSTSSKQQKTVKVIKY